MNPRHRREAAGQPLAEDELARLTFHGAVGEVTGSCYLLETRQTRVLIECGLIQGGRKDEARNALRFPFDPAALDAVVLTHAHIDHSGRLPKLVRDGFNGWIHATEGTCNLLGIMLPDSAHIQEQDARRNTRRRLRQGRKAERPLYTIEDARQALEQCSPCALGEWRSLAPDLRVRFRRAGHILGSASVELDIGAEGQSRRLVVSGDVGRAVDPLLRDPDAPERADLLLLESTYGDRDHRAQHETLDEFAEILDHAARENANVIVPVFAVGRAQEVLHHIGVFEREGRLQPRPVYLDSPMAISVTDLYAQHVQDLEPEILAAVRAGEPFSPENLRFCRTPEESMALNDRQGIVILAASGMCNAGRVVHHLKHNLWRREAHVVIVGFQARGTVGRSLVDGARSVRILGETIAVRARIHTVGGFSAHAGQSELIEWSSKMIEGGAQVALVHGEPDRRSKLRTAMSDLCARPIWAPLPGAAVRFTGRGKGLALDGPQQTD